MKHTPDVTHQASSSTDYLDRWVTLEYVDLVRFNSDGKIATIREFFDTRLLHDLVREHEGKQKDTKETEKEKETAKETAKPLRKSIIESHWMIERRTGHSSRTDALLLL